MAFIASIPVGPVNLAVVQVSLRSGKTAGLWIAAGSAIAELGYAMLAVWGVNLFLTNPKIMLAIQMISIPVLLILGFKNIMNPPADQQETDNTQKNKGTFFLGFSLTILNPLLLPFWLFMCAWIRGVNFNNIALLHSTTDSIAFAFGVATGSFLLLFLVAFLSAGKEMSFETKKTVYKILGWLFISISMYQIYQVWSSFN